MSPELLAKSAELWTQIGETITQIIAFVIFCWIMKKYAWGPVMNVLDERQAKIEAGFDDIRHKQDDADQLCKEYDERLAEIEQEARAKIQEAIAEGRRVSGELTDEAHLEASRITDHAQRNIRLEIAKARQDLRDELVSMTIDSTRRLMGEALDDEGHRKLVAGFIADLEGEMPQ